MNIGTFTRSSWCRPESPCCIEVGAFGKSTYSFQEANCVEAGQFDLSIYVRDSKLPPGSPVLIFAPGAWTDFIYTIREQHS